MVEELYYAIKQDYLQIRRKGDDTKYIQVVFVCLAWMKLWHLGILKMTRSKLD